MINRKSISATLRSHFVAGVVALLALSFGLVARRAPEILVQPGMSVTPYSVTNAAAFPALPLPPRAFVFLNGLFQTPLVDYDVLPDTGQGAHFVFRRGFVSTGDRVSVVVMR